MFRSRIDWRGVDLVADLETLITTKPLESSFFLPVKVVEQRVIGNRLIRVDNGLEQFLIGRHGIGIAVISLLGCGGGIPCYDAGPVIPPVRNRQ